MPGIVIVTYNSADVIQKCVESCLAITGAKIVVIDNASQDDTLKRIPKHTDVHVIANTRNLGFGAAVNQGFGVLHQEEAILILNPDAMPESGIEKLVSAVTTDNVAGATGRLTDSSGVDQHGFNVRSLPTAWTLAFEVLAVNRLWRGNPLNRRYRLKAPASGGEIEQPAGAFLMIRRSAWSDVGGFDEGFYPIWFEDVDFCKRLRERGYRLRFVPEAVARHQGGHSASSLSWGERQLFWYGSLLKYASKHFSAGSRRVVALSVMLACFPRMIVGMFQVGVPEPVSVYSRVIWLAGQCLRQGERGPGSPG